MPEQLSDIEESSSSASTSDLNEEEFWSWKTMSQYARELICLLAFFLTTYATFQNRTQKFARPPPPTYLFGKNSMIQEYSDGQLGVIQAHVAVSELSLVFFYAPWCAESRFAKTAIEYLAKQFAGEVYFAAVNCWQPGGECKMQYPRVDSWPILMAYYPRGLAIQYNGLWNVKSVASFFDKLLNPVNRIETERDLLRAKINNYAVVVGFFPSTQPSEKYQIFFQAAVKSLEHSPLRGIEYGIVTGESTKLFNLSSLPTIEMHSLNSTLVYEEKSWTVDGINNWIKNSFDAKNTWVEISGKKSWNFSNHLKKSPTLLTFHPRHYLGNYNDIYYMIRQVAFAYHDCRLNQSSFDESVSSIKSLRDENIKNQLDFKLKCSQIRREPTENFKPSQNCNVTELLTSDINMFESAKNINMLSYCPCNQEYSKNKIKSEKNRQKFPKKITQLDTKHPSYLLQRSIEHKCWKLTLTESTSEYDIDHEVNTNFTGIGCRFNRTLSFVMADSDLYNYMMKSLGMNLPMNNNISKGLIFIVDKERESTFQMKENISTSTIMKFIQNFHNNLLSRNLRKKVLSQKIKSLLEKRIHIKEINSSHLKERIKSSHKSMIILFYTSQCALCNIFSRALLSIARLLERANIQTLRVDGENNDFPWEYTMDSFPTLLAVPKEREVDARIYPRNVKISTRNILRFILTTLDTSERLHLVLEICKSFQAEDLLPNCMRNFRIEILNAISQNLHQWRSTILRNETVIMEKLQILHKLYYLTFQVHNDESNVWKTISNNIVILGGS